MWCREEMIKFNSLTKEEKQLYMPETIECVDDETVESFIRNYKKVVFR